MADSLSPDFQKCAVHQRWKGSNLAGLFIQLHQEAGRSYVSKEDIEADRGWYWRVLPHGAFVGMRKRADVAPSSSGRLELRIARSGELKPEVESRWVAEVKTFLKHFQVEVTNGRTPAASPDRYWMQIQPTEKEASRPVARFLLLLLGEIRPGVAFCHDCLHQDPPIEKEIVWEAAFGCRGQACPACALERGRRLQREHASRGQQAALPL